MKRLDFIKSLFGIAVTAPVIAKELTTPIKITGSVIPDGTMSLAPSNKRFDNIYMRDGYWTVNGFYEHLGPNHYVFRKYDTIDAPEGYKWKVLENGNVRLSRIK